MIKYIPTAIADVVEIIPEKFGDDRGYFAELIHFETLYTKTQCRAFVQENESFSVRGVLRGMHLQVGETSQAKLVRVAMGQVLDVVVDLRLGSQTYGKHVAVLLDSDLKNQLFVPHGFAHGFLTISDKALFNYKVDYAYSPQNEACLSPFDESLAIPWERLVAEATSDKAMTRSDFILSPKDLKGLSLEQYRSKYANL